MGLTALVLGIILLAGAVPIQDAFASNGEGPKQKHIDKHEEKHGDKHKDDKKKDKHDKKKKDKHDDKKKNKHDDKKKLVKKIKEKLEKHKEKIIQKIKEKFANYDGDDRRGHDDSHDDSNDDSHGDHNSEKKILVCHIPPGNSDNAHTISISKKALQTHLDHGDTLGKCEKYEDLRDKQDPKVKITSPKKNKKVEGSTITVTVTATDKLSGVESVIVRLDRGSYKTAVLESDGTWAVEFTDVDDGKHKVTVKAKDFAGNDKRKHVKFRVI